MGTNGRENSNFENDDNTITNQPAETFQWKGEYESRNSQEPILLNVKLDPYEEIFECSNPEWHKFFWITCLLRLPGRAIRGYILAERMRIQKYRIITFLVSAVIERNLMLEGVITLICLTAELVLIYALIRQRRLFVLERPFEMEENSCESCLITFFCTPCSHGQMGAYTKRKSMENDDVGIIV